MKLFNGKDYRLCRSQFGEIVYAKTAKELARKVGYAGSPRRMYADKKDGRTVHVGYVVGHSWFSVFAALEMEV